MWCQLKERDQAAQARAASSNLARLCWEPAGGRQARRELAADVAGPGRGRRKPASPRSAVQSVRCRTAAAAENVSGQCVGQTLAKANLIEPAAAAVTGEQWDRRGEPRWPSPGTQPLEHTRPSAEEIPAAGCHTESEIRTEARS
jgi:hypothetical protein